MSTKQYPNLHTVSDYHLRKFLSVYILCMTNDKHRIAFHEHIAD